jgi:hypothetical protein
LGDIKVLKKELKLKLYFKMKKLYQNAFCKFHIKNWKNLEEKRDVNN